MSSLDARGSLTCCEKGLPREGDADCAIRAALLRLILVGAADAPRLPENGLRLSGAWITGVLDLQGCRIPTDVAFADCRFDATPNFQSAMLDSLLLDGSVLPGLKARWLEARGSVNIRLAMVDGPIDMRGARLDGEVVLDGSTLHGAGMALDVSFIRTGGDLTMRHGCVQGYVKASGAQVSGDLILTGASVAHPDGVALAANRVRIDGDVELSAARIFGETSMIRAQIGGDLRLDGGVFTAPGALALTLNRASIKGALFLRRGASVDGALGLSGAYASVVVDEPASWPKQGDLLLNRFRYDGFIGGPVDAPTRLLWLARQSPERWGEDFWPQPYEQLSGVLREMGHAQDARLILYEKERLQRRCGRRQAKTSVLRALLGVRDAVLAVTIGYGLNPLLSIVWLITIWLAGVALLASVEAAGDLRPNSAVVLRSPEWVLCGAPAFSEVYLPSLNQTRAGLAFPGDPQMRCFLAQPEAHAFPHFNKWVYSLEAMLPGLQAGQHDYWSPDTRVQLGYVAKLFEYCQRVAGFALGLLAVAGFSGIVRSK